MHNLITKQPKEMTKKERDRQKKVERKRQKVERMSNSCRVVAIPTPPHIHVYMMHLLGRDLDLLDEDGMTYIYLPNDQRSKIDENIV